MRAPFTTCSWRNAVAVLASGAVISLSALSGGVAPAFAKPDKNDPGIPVIPTPEVVIPEAPQAIPQEQAPAERPREQQQPPTPPQVIEAPPVQAPAPQVQAPAPEPAPEPKAPQPVAPAPEPQPQPQVQAPAPEPKAPAPQIAAPAPKKEQPRVVDAPKVDAPKVEAPTSDAPKADPPQSDAPKANAPKADAPKAEVPAVDAPAVDAPKPDATLPLPAVDQPATPGDPKQDAQLPRNLAPGADEDAPADKQPAVGDGPKSDSTEPSEAKKAAQQVALASPDKLEAPEQDIQLARQAKPVEVKPEPAKRDDVAFLSSALNIESKTKLGPFESEFKVGSEFSIGDRDRDRDRDRDWDWDNKHWDKRVRQWDRKWIEYDDFYRPVFFNPYRAPVRIVYIYERAPRIVYLPPLARVVVDAAALAAYSFTAVVLNAANLAADVAVGTFFGGGFVPPIGAPFVPPPPLLNYNNVPVQVRYSDATYQPFRVNNIVDLGDDVQYGGRKVLLDGATPAWGQWTTSPTGERQFEVHRTQQYPGLGEPQEAPLPGDYRMQLASDESGGDDTQMYLVAAGGVVGGLGLGALGLALYLGRRRLQS